MKLHELTDLLTNKMNFEFEKQKKLGHVRVQFGNEKLIANQFVPSEDFADNLKKYNLESKKINDVVNCIQFELLGNFENLLLYCTGINSKDETNWFLQEGHINYWIRLIPTFGTSEYNCYIHFYHE